MRVSWEPRTGEMPTAMWAAAGGLGRGVVGPLEDDGSAGDGLVPGAGESVGADASREDAEDGGVLGGGPAGGGVGAGDADACRRR